jgi:serine/threonine protein phosphatase PrpC
MQYATHYDVGDRKRTDGINEDSVAITVFEDGHRDGYLGPSNPPAEGGDDGDASSEDGSETGGDEDSEDGESGSGGSDSVDDATPAPDAQTTVLEGDTDETERDEGEADATGDRDPQNRSAAVFALADGAGGHEAGDVASYIASTVVSERLAGTAVRAARSDPGGFGVPLESGLPEPPRDDDLEAAVAEAIVAAHREIVAYAAESGQQAHTTVVAGVCVGGRLHYGWVGDSRAYVVNAAREEITRLTADHAVVERLREAGQIDDVEAMVHPRGNEITRALGGTGMEDPETATVEVETRTVPVYAEDVVLVTSDGLVDAQTEATKLYEWYVEADRDEDMAEVVRDRAVTDDELRECVLSARSIEDAAADLTALANDRGGKDNLSTVLFRDGTLAETPADPPDRSVHAPPAVEDRQTLLGGTE